MQSVSGEGGGGGAVSVAVVKVGAAAWNHVCVMWRRQTGYVTVYVNATSALDLHQPSVTRVMHQRPSTIRLGQSCFLLRDTMLARYMLSPCVCLSVRVCHK